MELYSVYNIVFYCEKFLFFIADKIPAIKNKFIFINPKPRTTTNVDNFPQFFAFLISYPHPHGVVHRTDLLFLYLIKFPVPFYHPLVYNNTVIRDILLYISKCSVHLHLLLVVCENFQVTLKMYFLCSVLSP